MTIIKHSHQAFDGIVSLSFAKPLRDDLTSRANSDALGRCRGGLPGFLRQLTRGYNPAGYFPFHSIYTSRPTAWSPWVTQIPPQTWFSLPLPLKVLFNSLQQPPTASKDTQLPLKKNLERHTGAVEYPNYIEGMSFHAG